MVRSCKLGSAHDIQSESGSSAPTPTQLEVVNMVQHVIFKQNMVLSAITQVQPEFAREMQRRQQSLKLLQNVLGSEGNGISRLGNTEAESLSPEFLEADQRSMLESLENSQNLLRQQEAKVRAWFTLFFVTQNCGLRF